MLAIGNYFWGWLRTSYGCLVESWIGGRWLVLKVISMASLTLFGRSRRIERSLIKIGDMIFEAQYAPAIHEDYSSYFVKYPGNLDPYFILYDKTKWLDRRVILDLGSGLGQYSELLIRYGAKRVVSLEYQYD